MDDLVTKIFDPIFNGILNVLEVVIGFLFAGNMKFVTYAIVINVIGFVLMYRDKQYAKEDKWRIKEGTLMLTAIVGGSLGIYFGMQKFRHKTKHSKFTIGIPVIIALQIMFITYVVLKNFFA